MLHTLKYRLHTLIKRIEYQIDNVLVYAVYAKTKLFLSEPSPHPLPVTLRKGQALKLSFGAWPQREVFWGGRKKIGKNFLYREKSLNFAAP